MSLLISSIIFVGASELASIYFYNAMILFSLWMRSLIWSSKHILEPEKSKNSKKHSQWAMFLGRIWPSKKNEKDGREELEGIIQSRSNFIIIIVVAIVLFFVYVKTASNLESLSIRGSFFLYFIISLFILYATHLNHLLVPLIMSAFLVLFNLWSKDFSFSTLHVLYALSFFSNFYFYNLVQSTKKMNLKEKSTKYYSVVLKNLAIFLFILSIVNKAVPLRSEDKAGGDNPKKKKRDYKETFTNKMATEIVKRRTSQGSSGSPESNRSNTKNNGRGNVEGADTSYFNQEMNNESFKDLSKNSDGGSKPNMPRASSQHSAKVSQHEGELKQGSYEGEPHKASNSPAPNLNQKYQPTKLGNNSQVKFPQNNGKQQAQKLPKNNQKITQQRLSEELQKMNEELKKGQGQGLGAGNQQTAGQEGENTLPNSENTSKGSLKSKGQGADDTNSFIKNEELAKMTSANNQLKNEKIVKEKKRKREKHDIRQLSSKIENVFNLLLPIIKGLFFLIIGYFILSYVLKLNKKKDPEEEEIRALTPEQINNLKKDIANLNKIHLSPDQEVLKSYYSFLKVMEAVKKPRDSSLPVTDFSYFISNVYPQLEEPVNQLTERFCHTYYGNQEVLPEELKNFRKARTRVFGYFIKGYVKSTN